MYVGNLKLEFLITYYKQTKSNFSVTWSSYSLIFVVIKEIFATKNVDKIKFRTLTTEPVSNYQLFEEYLESTLISPRSIKEVERNIFSIIIVQIVSSDERKSHIVIPKGPTLN